MKRTASAIWKGSLKTGKGELTTASGVLKATPYSFSTRFEGTPGTNPEELIAAAHSGCFAMALSGALGKWKYEPKKLEVTAEVSLDQDGEGWSVTHSRLTLKADIPGINKETFLEIAEDAKNNCPVSKLLTAEISLDAELVSAPDLDATI
ncbi:OsmC family protein [Bdellovibrio sp. HCB2-146]|uniref:OsmC family protein n=1 Tax=Bdellovibrio sp. HCB2-146 TaxID=3394362 RepID=UPI0039BD871B